MCDLHLLTLSAIDPQWRLLLRWKLSLIAEVVEGGQASVGVVEAEKDQYGVYCDIADWLTLVATVYEQQVYLAKVWVWSGKGS